MGIFNMENKLFQGLSQVTDAILLNLLWLVFCIPVVTIGASTTAFFYTIHKVLRRQRGYIWRSFWESFRSNLKQSTLIWLIQLFLFCILWADRKIMRGMVEQNSSYGAVYYIFLILMMFWTVWCIYTMAYAARFELGLKQTMKNGALLAIAHLPWSMLIMFMFLISYVIVVYLSPFFIMLLPVGVGFLYDVILDRIFRKYMREEDLKKEEELDQQMM